MPGLSVAAPKPSERPFPDLLGRVVALSLAEQLFESFGVYGALLHSAGEA